MTSTLILYILRFLAALILPVCAIVFTKVKFAGKIGNFFGGVAVYFVFYCLIFAVISTYLEVVAKVFEKVENPITRGSINIIFETVCVAFGYLILFKAAVKKKNDNGIGVMTGVGFSSMIMLIAYALPSVVNAVIAGMYMKNTEAEISGIFESNVAQVFGATPLSMFYDLLIMICLFVLEVAVAVIFYRVLRCEDRKIWLLAAVILRIGCYIVIGLGSVMNTAVIVIVAALIVLVAVGAAYSLTKPFAFKNEE